MTLGASPGRAGWSGWLVLLDEVAGEDALLLLTAVVHIFAGIPIRVLFLGDRDYLADVELQIIIVPRVVLVDGLDLEGHGDAAVGTSDAQGASSMCGASR